MSKYSKKIILFTSLFFLIIGLYLFQIPTINAQYQTIEQEEQLMNLQKIIIDLLNQLLLILGGNNALISPASTNNSNNNNDLGPQGKKACQACTIFNVPFGAYLNRAVGDIDNDGKNDLVISSGVPNERGDNKNKVNDFWLYVFDNIGNVKNGWPRLLSFGPDSTADPSVDIAGNNPIIADLDNNNTKEIVVAVVPQKSSERPSVMSRIDIFRANGEYFPGWPVYIKPAQGFKGSYIYGDPVVGDITGNGKMEIVVNVFHMNASNDQTHLISGLGQTYAYDINGKLLNNYPVAFQGGSDRSKNWTSPVIGQVVFNENVPFPKSIVTTSISGEINVLGKDGERQQFIQLDNIEDSFFYGMPFLTLSNLDDPKSAANSAVEIILNGTNIDSVLGYSSIYAIRGKENFAYAKLYPSGPDRDFFVGRTAIGYLTNSLTPDIVSATLPDHENNTVTFYGFNDGKHSFSATGEIFGITIPGFILGDITGDGHQEIIYASLDQEKKDYDVFNIWALDYRGSVVKGFPLSYTGNYLFPYDMSYSPTLVDFDKNGKLDIIMNHPTLGVNGIPDGKGEIVIMELPFPYNATNQKLDWPKFQRDNYNSGCFESPNSTIQTCQK